MRFQGQPLPCRLQHGGLADNIFRKSGVDNTVVESCTVENINVVLYPGDTFKELSGVTATYKSNDRADSTDVERELNGTYLVRNGAY